MPDIDRRPDSQSIHRVHLHNCPNCHRDWSCACAKQEDRNTLVCRDCEMGVYNPRIHGGTGDRSEA